MIMDAVSPARITPQLQTQIISALRRGVAPESGIAYIWVNRRNELLAVERHLRAVADGGSGLWVFVGKVGSGKSALQSLIRVRAGQRNFVMTRADLTMGQRFAGASQAAELYRQLISTMTLPPTAQSEDPLRHLVTLASGKAAAESPEDPISVLEAQLGASVLTSDLARAVAVFGAAETTEAVRRDVLRWLRGEIRQRDAAASVGVRFIVAEHNYFAMLKLLARLARFAGFAGMLVAIDEVSTLATIPNSATRLKNYERLLHILNDIQQQGAPGLAVFLTGTEECVDAKRGFYSLEALRTRLAPHRHSAEGYADYDAPLLRLTAIPEGDIPTLLAKVHAVVVAGQPHGDLVTADEISQFVAAAPRVIGTSSISTRELLKDFVGRLGVLAQEKEHREAQHGGD
jgi:hypothetical protein